MEKLQELLESLRRMLQQYEDAEREARARLEQVAQGRLMQAGAVRGVEMAIEEMKRATGGLPAAGSEGDGGGV